MNPSSEKAKVDSKEALLLRSTLRMVRDQFRATTYMVPEGNSDCMSVVALCNLSRAAAISIRLYGREMIHEELDELRFILRRFGTRWNLGRKRTVYLLSKYSDRSRYLSPVYR